MNKNVGIATAVGIVVIIGVLIFQINDLAYDRTTSEEFYQQLDHDEGKTVKNVVYPENPQILYGVTINKDKYLLGENIFVKIQGIPMGLQDYVQFYTPNGILYLNLEIDGDEKSSFKHYFRPSLQKGISLDEGGICEKEDLVGKWTVMFRGLPEDRLHFEIMDEILPYSEEYYAGCNEDPYEVRLQPSLSP